MASISMPREAAGSTRVQGRAVDACERLTAAALLAVLSPVAAASALAIRLLSRRTPWIAHRRVGWRGETLWVLKLRTMWDAAPARGRRGWIEYIEDDEGPQRKQPADARVISRFARFCRRHSIDEIPQLWQVVTGEMALVGPRPLTAEELRRHYGDDAEEILAVKPGVIGLSQVSGRSRLTYPERRMLDLRMARSRSPLGNLKILALTVPEVFSGKNSW